MAEVSAYPYIPEVCKNGGPHHSPIKFISLVTEKFKSVLENDSGLNTQPGSSASWSSFVRCGICPSTE